jgi:indole-3-glycerol phosphate synthase
MEEKMDDILQKIAAQRAIRIAEQKKIQSLDEVREQAAAVTVKRPDFAAALAAPGVSFICEVKKASPSKGLIAPNFPYLQIAEEYAAAGASAISVLTEPDFFLGSGEYLREIAEKVNVPLLCKDFIIDEYQIYQAKIWGASAVLLIVALLPEEKLKAYLALAESLGLVALVETHDEQELRLALACGAKIIGVNNRNLRDFTVDFGNSLRLRNLAPADVIFVAESGISNAADVAALAAAGVNAVLVGEALMRSPDKKQKLAELAGKGII